MDAELAHILNMHVSFPKLDSHYFPQKLWYCFVKCICHRIHQPSTTSILVPDYMKCLDIKENVLFSSYHEKKHTARQYTRYEWVPEDCNLTCQKLAKTNKIVKNWLQGTSRSNKYALCLFPVNQTSRTLNSRKEEYCVVS